MYQTHHVNTVALSSSDGVERKMCLFALNGMWDGRKDTLQVLSSFAPHVGCISF